VGRGQRSAGAYTRSVGQDLELPPPLSLVRTTAWNLIESIGFPVVALVVGAWLGGRDAGLLAGLGATWIAAVIRKLGTGTVPALVAIMVTLLTLQTALAVGTGNKRFFRGATWLWAAIFLLLGGCMGALLATQTTAAFRVFSLFATVTLIVLGVGASTVWLRSVLHRLGLSVRFVAG
jgi:hypothetical protein